MNNLSRRIEVKNRICRQSLLPKSVICILADNREEIAGLLAEYQAAGIELVQLRLDENTFVQTDGTILSNESFATFDYFVDECSRRGLLLALTLSTSWRFGDSLAGMFNKPIESYDPIRAEMKRFEAYFTALFTHENCFGGKPLYEYNHLLAVEPLAEMAYQEAPMIFWFCFLISPFIDHCFGNQVFKFYSGDASLLSEESKQQLDRWNYRLLAFLPLHETQAFDSYLPGLPVAEFNALIRESGEGFFCPLAVTETFSSSDAPHRNGGSEGFISFSSRSTVELKFDFPVPVASAKFRPSLKNPVTVKVDGNTVALSLEARRYGVLEINYDAPDQPAYTVYLFNDKLLTDPRLQPEYFDKVKCIAPGRHLAADLKADGARLLYFLPGVHRIDNDKLILESDCDVYLARGVVLKAGIAADRVENVRIFGHGIIDATANVRLPGENWKSLGEEGCLFFLYGQNIVIDGPVLYNPQFWAVVIAGTTGMTIRNFKVLAWVVNDDGLQPRSVNDFTVEHCFIKSMDDCVAIKTRRAIGMVSRSLRFRDLVLWQDFAHGLEIGHTSQADLLEDIRFEDIEFIRGGNNALSMHVMDHETVRDVTYDRIYFEGKPFSYLVGFSIIGNPSPYRTDDDCGQIMNVTIKNLYFEGQPYPAHILGYDADHVIRNVRFADIHYGLGERNDLTVETLEQLNLSTRFAEAIELVK